MDISVSDDPKVNHVTRRKRLDDYEPDFDSSTHAEREADAGVGNGGFWEGKDVSFPSRRIGEMKSNAEDHR